MIFRRRGRFDEVVRRQLELFAADHEALLARVDAAERAYGRAARAEAEERYGDLADLVDEGTELLAAMRDAYAATLDGAAADEYADAFARGVRRRLPRFGLEIGEA